MKSPSIPQLPFLIGQWSARGLAEHLGVSTSTVKYHARQVFRLRREQGRWEFNSEQAQRVANHIHQFGQRETLRKSSPAPETKELNAD